MWYPSVVVGIRLEPRSKHVVPVLARNMDVLGTRLVVAKVDRGQLEFGYHLCALHGEAVQLVAWMREVTKGGGIAAVAEDGGLLRGEEARERRATAEHCAWWRVVVGGRGEGRG